MVLLFPAGEVRVEVGLRMEKGRVVEVLSGVGEVEGEVVDNPMREDVAHIGHQVLHEMECAAPQELHIYGI